eukprot:10037381-Alexandrium_andersonii.AAC.1
MIVRLRGCAKPWPCHIYTIIEASLYDRATGMSCLWDMRGITTSGNTQDQSCMIVRSAWLEG